MWQELLNIFQQKDVLVHTQTRVASLRFFGLYCIDHNLYIHKSNFKLLIYITCNHLFNWSPFIQLPTDMEITEKMGGRHKGPEMGGVWGGFHFQAHGLYVLLNNVTESSVWHCLAMRIIKAVIIFSMFKNAQISLRCSISLDFS